MAKKDFVTEEFFVKKITRMEKNIIQKLNMVINTFDRITLNHGARIERLERVNGLPKLITDN